MKRLLFFLLVIPFCLHAQEEVYDLRKCLETGLQYNYDIKIVRNNQQISDNNVTPGNAGYLPVINLSSDYTGALNNIYRQYDANGTPLANANNTLNQSFNAGVYLTWTVFNGFTVHTNYQRLKELQQMGELNTRIEIDNFIASLSAEYYNYIRQSTRLENLRYAVRLSKERLRIAEERYGIGSVSRMDMQQAKVDFNADSSRLVRQKEVLYASRIELNRLMGIGEIEMPVITADTSIEINVLFTNKEERWQDVLVRNPFLLLSEREIFLSQLDLRTLQSVNYPYLRLNAGYGYTHARNQAGVYRKQNTLGLTYGATLGFTLFDGMNRTRQQRNAKIEIENQKLAYDNIILNLKSEFSNIWMAYQNNMGLLGLEEENVKTAEENYEIALERYKLGDLSGIELREAQNSLLEAEERLDQARYDIKLCELSLMQIEGRITDLLE